WAGQKTSLKPHLGHRHIGKIRQDIQSIKK
ncbi:hypothetical protein LCGC14_2203300, partial [marine sediment metagenome]